MLADPDCHHNCLPIYHERLTSHINSHSRTIILLTHLTMVKVLAYNLATSLQQQMQYQCLYHPGIMMMILMKQPLLQCHLITVITIELTIILKAPLVQINHLQISATSQLPVTLLVQWNSTNQMSGLDTVRWYLDQHLLQCLR